MKRYKIIITACICLLNVIHLQSQTYTFPEMVIEDTTISNGTHIFDNTGAVISPSDTSKHVTITGSANVEFTSSYMVHLKPGFRATAFTGGGYFHAGTSKQAFTALILEPGSSVMKYDKLEIGIDLPGYIDSAVANYFADNSTGINPFAPDTLNIEAEFVSPTGVHTKRFGFYYRGYERLFDSITSKYTDWAEDTADHYNYRVRFAPDETGSWQCKLSVYVNMGDIMAPLSDVSLNFTCVSNNSGLDIAKGWLEVGNRNRYLRYHDTQESFFAIGENISSGTMWEGIQPTDFTIHSTFINELSLAGGNFIRMRMPPWAYGIERERLGNYATEYYNPRDGLTQNRQMNAWELDNIIEYSKEKDIQIMLTLDAEGAMSESWSDWNNSDWARNPYKLELGLQDQHELFTDSAAFEYFKRRYRYIVSRWGYATNLAILEFFNEMELDYNYLDTIQGWNPLTDEDVDIWHDKMGNYLNIDLDYNRLLSTNLGNTYATVNLDTTMDVTSVHHYFVDRDANHYRYNFTQSFLSRYDKPFIFGELGMYYTPHLDVCKDISFHNAIWSTSFMGGYGCGLYWWWDSAIHPTGYYTQFQQLRDFMAGVDFDNMGFTAYNYPDNYSPNRNDSIYPIEAFYMVDGSKDNIIGWAHNRSYYWYNYTSDWKACRDDYNSANNIDTLTWSANDSLLYFYLDTILHYPYPVERAKYLLPAEVISTKPYIKNYYKTPTPVTDSIVVNNTQNGDYLLKLFDTSKGIYVSEDTVTAENNMLKIQLITNDTFPDMAFKLEYIGNSFKNYYVVSNSNTEIKHLKGDNNLLSEYNNIIVSPNPATTNLNIRFSGNSAIYNVNLYDKLGRLLHSYNNVESALKLDLTGLQPGVYILKVESENTESKSIKFIKM